MHGVPDVSVILPVFNGADYIKSSISSVLAQDIDLELLVSDNCSTDDTCAIVKSIDDKRLRLLENPTNLGLFGNFNSAMRVARGAYIQLFSHDDIALPGFLQSQIRSFNHDANREIGLVYSSCWSIDADGHVGSSSSDENTPTVIDFPCYLYISSRYGALPASISTVMLSRACYEACGEFDFAMKVAGDLDFYNRVAERFDIVYNRDTLVQIRSHRGAVSQNSTSALNYILEEATLIPFYKKHLSADNFSQAMKFRIRTRGAQHATYLLRRAIKLDVDTVLRGSSALGQVHSVPQSICHALNVAIHRLSERAFKRLRTSEGPRA